MKTLAAPITTPTHFAGFDGLRLIAAVAVIFSHAFLIATGNEADRSWLFLESMTQLLLGVIAGALVAVAGASPNA